MAGISLRLLVVVLLCFTQLIMFSNAIPSTRTRSLEYKSQVYVILPATTNDHMANGSKKWKMEKMKMNRRMELELNDYPGSGPNNRHTPRPQVGKSCVDC